MLKYFVLGWVNIHLCHCSASWKLSFWVPHGPILSYRSCSLAGRHLGCITVPPVPELLWFIIVPYFVFCWIFWEKILLTSLFSCEKLLILMKLHFPMGKHFIRNFLTGLSSKTVGTAINQWEKVRGFFAIVLVLRAVTNLGMTIPTVHITYTSLSHSSWWYQRNFQTMNVASIHPCIFYRWGSWDTEKLPKITQKSLAGDRTQVSWLPDYCPFTTRLSYLFESMKGEQG